MQIKKRDSVLDYDSAYWSSGTQLNADKTTEVVGFDVVLPEYSTAALNGIRICVTYTTNCYTYMIGTEYSSALALFDGTYRRTDDMEQKTFEDLFSSYHDSRPNHVSCLQKPGFNTQCIDNNRARFGFCGNLAEQTCQPNDTDDADFAIGIGCYNQDFSNAVGLGFGAGFGDGYVDGFRTSASLSNAGETFQAWVYAVWDANASAGVFATYYSPPSQPPATP